MEEIVKKIACPCCTNKRLLDLDPDTEGMISIKCPRCKAVVTITIHKKKIVTERTDADWKPDYILI